MTKRVTLSNYLYSIEDLIRYHLPVYFSEWDRMSTAVCWLLRRQRNKFYSGGQTGFWKNPDKSKPLRIPYDFIQSDYKYLDCYSPMELPQKAKKFIETFLSNVETIVNVKFVKAHLPNLNKGNLYRPQLRFGYSKLKGRKDAEAAAPGSLLSGGDIWLGTKAWTNDFPEEDYSCFLVHETGHALGLEHMHSDSGRDKSYTVGGKKIKYHGIDDHLIVVNHYKYDDQRYSAMSYRGKNPIQDHFGIFDYMALIAVYGPNSNNQHVKDIVASYKNRRMEGEDFVRIEDFTPENFRKIARCLPAVPGSTSNKHHVYSTHQEIPGSKPRIWRDRQHFVEGSSVSINFSGLRTQNTLYNGFNHKMQILHDGEVCKDMSFSKDTMISCLVGTRQEDVYICSKQLQRAQGHRGNDIYVLYGHNWGAVTIDDTIGNDENEISFIIFYDTNISYLSYKYEGLNDLIIYDSRKPQRFVRIKDYFRKPKLFFIGFLHSYKNHYRYTNIKNYPDFINEVNGGQMRLKSAGQIHLPKYEDTNYKVRNIPHFDHRKITAAQVARRQGDVIELLCVQGINGDQCPAYEILYL